MRSLFLSLWSYLAEIQPFALVGKMCQNKWEPFRLDGINLFMISDTPQADKANEPIFAYGEKTVNKSNHLITLCMFAGMLTGMAIGCMIGIFQGNMGKSMCFGLVFGMIIGIAIGTAIKKKQRMKSLPVYQVNFVLLIGKRLISHFQQRQAGHNGTRRCVVAQFHFCEKQGREGKTEIPSNFTKLSGGN